MDDEPDWKRRAVAIEYWVLAALIGGSLLYGLMLGVIDLFSR